jgi:hypothetical protein
MSNASLELGGDNWAAKDTKLLASTVSDDSGRFYPREFTFARGSNLSATRVNEDGLIEKGYENLLLNSNLFDNGGVAPTIWQKGQNIVTGGQAGYDGTNDAWLIDKQNTSGTYIAQGISKTGVHTISLYAKAGSLKHMVIWASGGDVEEASFLLEGDGSITRTFNTPSASIQRVGASDWYRCEIVVLDTSQIRIYPASSGSSVSGTLGNIYIQDAMLNQGLAALPYIESGASTAKAGILENEPRIDYSSGTASLLLEPQRTNLITQSEYIAGLSIASSATLSLESEANPSGGGFAYKVTATEVSSRVQRSIGTQGSNFVFSGFFKGSGAATRIRFRNNQGEGVFYNIDANGAFTLYSENAVNDNYGIEDYGNGWHRIFFETTTSNSSVNYAQVYCDVLDGDGSVLAWGLQAEQGSYPTSYIPTYGTSQTRADDFGNNNNILAKPVAFGANDDFTFYYEGSFDKDGNNGMVFGGGAAGSGADYKNYLWLTASGMLLKGTSETSMASTTFNQVKNTNYKLLVKRDGSRIDFFINGTKIPTTQASTNTAFTLRSVGWSYSNTVYQISGNIKQFKALPTALTDNECIELTTI